MRHQKAGRKFSRTSAHRKAMFSNLLASLVMHERIETTEPKAKELKRLADRTISWGTSVGELVAKGREALSVTERAKIVHAKRMAGRILRSSEALDKLFGEIAPRFKGRPGGYTRLLKTRVRVGDAAPMSFIELVGREERSATKAAPASEETKRPKKSSAEKSAKAAEEASA